MESIFIGLWIFGWDRLSKSAFALHLACILRNDYVIFLDFDGKLIHAGAGRLYD